jgi:hypothetical protein
VSDSSDDLITNLLIWCLVPIFLGVMNSGKRSGGGTLVYSYFISMVINYWIGALVHVSPASPFLNSSVTALGFREATYGLIAFTIGSVIVPAKVGATRRSPGVAVRVDGVTGIANRYIAVGIVSWMLSYTAVNNLPSVTSLIAVGKQCAIIGICFRCWAAWQGGKWVQFSRWLLASLAFPVVTVILQGFIGFGMVMVSIILAFVGTFYRPKWRVVVGMVAAIFIAISFWVPYYQNREAIRATVWGGADLSVRIDALGKVLSDLAPFDLLNPTHLIAINDRLNQNELVGAAMLYTPQAAPFLNGATLWDAAIAIVPRAIWPDKPITAGSGDLVSEQTGIRFEQNTSVGIGHIMEFYINFGTEGVLAGLFAFGLMLGALDRIAANSLADGRWLRAASTLLVGIGALQVLGSLSETVMSMASAALASLAIAFSIRASSRRHGSSQVARPASDVAGPLS